MWTPTPVRPRHFCENWPDCNSGRHGDTWGPVLGAFIIIPLLELCNYYLQDFAGGGAGYALYGLLIVLIVLLRPSGLITLADVIREKLAKRKAARAVKGV